ncbi:MAG TPA: J domain-containing protein [Thermoanaerobaculia bacterium]|nr:J domain-containing protein [Thermoanaerobaculia bacterium]
MELVAVIVMIAAGGATAAFVLIAMAIARREGRAQPLDPAVERDRIAASLLFQIGLAGGLRPDEALRLVRRIGGLASPVTAGIDVANWGERFAQLASPARREWLLETAVKIAALARRVPVAQYAALLDLGFALGFHTDALARLREQYGFDYVDHAKEGRPRSAGRGRPRPLDERERDETAEMLRILGVEGPPSRQAIIKAYRKLVSRHHPDRFYNQPEKQTDAAARFIEITRAYEILMEIYRD